MTTRLITYLICAILGISICCIGGLLGLAGVAAACTPSTEPSAVNASSAALEGYDDDQINNASLITTVGADRGVPDQGQIIAVATAIQESSLRNLGNLGDHNDHDSLGLFQQRPSQGWGTPEQLMDPVYSSNKFYDKLLAVKGWQQMTLTEAAQAVQHSAYPDAYAKWQSDATALVEASTLAVGGCDGGDGMSDGGADLPADFSLPADTPESVAIAISWAVGQLGTPYSFGGSCTDPHSGDPSLECDCSSLVQQAYRHGGIYLPRTTDTQQDAGTAVPSVADLKPGDLIFIPGADGTMSDPGHVGLYMGQGLIIQSPHTGDVVKISKLSGWEGGIAKMRRVATWSS